MKVFKVNRDTVTVRPQEVRLLTKLRDNQFVLKRSDCVEGTGSNTHSVLPKRSHPAGFTCYDSKELQKLGIVIIAKDSGMRDRGGRISRFFSSHPRCKEVICGEPRRIHAILRQIDGATNESL